MGRVLMRVPLDFDYPLKEIWEGYLSEQPFDPPIGEGYQLWENTTEGSPISPVFDSLEDLCEWCEVNVSIFGYDMATKEEWFDMLNDGFYHVTRGNMTFF